MNPGRGKATKKHSAQRDAERKGPEFYFEPFCQLAPAFNGRGLLPFWPGRVPAKHADFHLGTPDWNYFRPISLSGIGGSNGGGQLLLGACNAHWSLGVLNRFTAFSCDLLR